MTERIMEQTMTNPVTIDFKRDNSGEWRVVGGGSAKNHKTTVAQGVSGQQLIFALTQDMVQKGYRFDVNDPIWVAVDNGQCPPSGASNGQITLVSPATASQVTVSDANSAPVVLRYQLNVFDENGNSAPIDPIIDNRGGGGGI